jgi:RNA polymerase sigma-70 factor, ECF subfamily
MGYVHLPAMAALASSVFSPEPRHVSDPDCVVMERIRADDREAVVELVRKYQHELVGFFYHQSWDQLVAEELAQDVFVNVYRARARWVPTAKVRTWIYRIAHNLWIDHLRRHRHHHTSLDAEVGESGLRLVELIEAPAAPEPDDGQAPRVRARIQQAVAALPEGQREVFTLANHQGMKYQDIANVLGIPEGTVKSRMHSAVRQLRDELADLVDA